MTDQELLRRAQQGDQHAFADLCERNRQRVWRIVNSVSRGADAEDLAQEVFVRAFRALPRFQGNAPFEAWLTRIAVNITHDHLRSAWRRKVMFWDAAPPETELGPSPAEESELRELQRRVRREVARLPDPQRTPIWLHFFEGFSFAEISRLDGTPEATIRSRVRAGLKKLSGSLEDLLPPPDPTSIRHDAMTVDPKNVETHRLAQRATPC